MAETRVSYEKFQFETFDSNVEDWEYYFQRFNIALELHGLDSNNEQNRTKRTQLLLSRIGPAAFKVLVDYFRPTPITSKTFEELINLLNDFCGKKTYVLAERVVFATKQREEKQSLSQYVLTLRPLAGYCKFGNTIDERIRDQLVIGINNQRWQQELIREHPTNSSKLEDIIAKKSIDIYQPLNYTYYKTETPTNTNDVERGASGHAPPTQREEVPELRRSERKSKPPARFGFFGF